MKARKDAASAFVRDGKSEPRREGAGGSFSGLRTALVLDALDAHGLKRQALACGLVARTCDDVVVGIAKPFLWMDFAHEDPDTYALELEAVASINLGDFVVCATADSARSAVWGELLTTAAIAQGAVGLVTDGAVRDVGQICAMEFPVYSQHLSPYDSFNRQKVVAYDVQVEISGVLICPGDIVVADCDGVAIVPADVALSISAWAHDKAGKENLFRSAVRDGMSLVDAYKKFGIL
jgi:4-hydroxy-4-methyl-2-oxoglutarate aldolase